MQTVIKSEFNFRDREANLCELTKEVWRRYFIGSEEEIKEALIVFDTDCIVIGTGKHEFYEGWDVFASEIGIALEQRKGILFQFKRFWAKMHIISDDVRLVYGEIDIDGNIAEGRARFTRDVHFSVCYHYSDDSWKIVSLVQSTPTEERGAGEHFPHILVDQIEKAWEHADKMTELAQKDNLTGLLNRGALDKMLMGFEGKSCMTVAVYVDLDNFKAVNDTFGHAVGDMVLRRVSEILKNVFRKEDNIARIGGDEFCAFFGIEATDHTRIQNSVCGRVERLLSKVPIIVCEGVNEVHVTFSIGICVHQIGNGITPAYVLEIADGAMYEVKKKTKNGACIRLEDGSVLRYIGSHVQSEGYRMTLPLDRVGE